MNFRLQTTLCPSCSRNVPREAEICVFCGVPTSTSTFADVAETPKVSIRAYKPLNPVTVMLMHSIKQASVLDLIDRQTRYSDMRGHYYLSRASS